MAVNPKMVQRIREFFEQNGTQFYEKKMFGGICFMVDQKMCCATHTHDQRTGGDVLLCRIGQERYLSAIQKPNVIPMDFTGKPMKGYVYITQNGFESNHDLAYWLQQCLDFNPSAKASSKKKP